MADGVESVVEREIGFVYFDLGNILLAFDHMVACQNVASEFGVEVGAVESAVYGTGLQVDYETGKIRQEVFLKEVRLNLGLSEATAPSQKLLDLLSDMFQPIASMLDGLRAVRDSGVPVGVLSNTCRSHWDWIHRQSYGPALSNFDSVILSFEVGAMKPDFEIYEAAEQAVDMPAEKILFLDDRQENIDAATKRGWQAFCCMGGVDAEGILKRFGFGV